MNIFLRTKASFLKKIHNLEMGNRGHSFLCRQGLMLITQAYHIQYKVSKFTLGELNAKVFLSKLERSERFFNVIGHCNSLHEGSNCRLETEGPWSVVVFVQSFPFNSYSPFFMTLPMDRQENTAPWEGIWHKKKHWISAESAICSSGLQLEFCSRFS